MQPRGSNPTIERLGKLSWDPDGGLWRLPSSLWNAYLVAVEDSECTYEDIRSQVREVAHERGYGVK